MPNKKPTPREEFMNRLTFYTMAQWKFGNSKRESDFEKVLEQDDKLWNWIENHVANEKKKAQKEILNKIARKSTDSADLFCEAIALSDIDYELNLLTQDK
jgi:hypothetical protein